MAKKKTENVKSTKVKKVEVQEQVAPISKEVKKRVINSGTDCKFGLNIKKCEQLESADVNNNASNLLFDTEDQKLSIFELKSVPLKSIEYDFEAMLN